MIHTLKIISAVLVTFSLAFSTSLLLEVPLVSSHWSRQVLVLMLMVVQLVFGAATIYRFIVDMIPNKNA